MSSPRAEFFPLRRLLRAVRWLLPAALLTLIPKCLLCLVAYAGLGAVLGFGGPEICGAPAGSPGSWGSSFAWPGAVIGLGAIGAFVSGRRGDKIPRGPEQVGSST